MNALRREEFALLGGQIYLNAAGIGPLPARTQRIVAEWTPLRAAPHGIPDEKIFGVLQAGRRAAARLIGADEGEIALATNTSYGINLAARMLPLGAGDVVLASAGEFPANVFPWRALADRGVRYETVPTGPSGWPDEPRMMERLADPAVKALAVSSVQYHTGYAVDLECLSAACRGTGTYLVVDAIQSLGVLPLDVRRTPVDILASGAQKWLLSPWGSGFVYVRKELIPRMAPAYVSWLGYEGTDDFSRLGDGDRALRPDARRYEFVTLPYQDIAGMVASLELLAELGSGAIESHVRATHAPVLEWARRRGVRLASPVGARGSGMICVAPRDLTSAAARLREHGVTATVREGALRFAPHCYTTVDEMERVAALLDRG